ncbi:Hpt domain-containing protein [Daejeonella sp.]|uniref:Hpt domain-containing protein n=1 Tax=Daejeonella sp. TaxID=2805397 RepID=UPI002730DA25|nr:Hpt domain-containing protein [Daejeonella sp.]MDP2412756.1 Hpt domain-containing protein [Daejeonella sp.]
MDNAGFKVDLTYLKDVASGSDEFMIDMIDLFLDQTPAYFEQLEQFIIEENWSKVADIAHKIKPTLAFMGVDSARESMAEIEQNARNLINLETISPSFQILKEMSVQLYKQLAEVKASLQNPS